MEEKQNESEFGIDKELKNKILNSLENDQDNQVKKLFLELHPADQADLISFLNHDDRIKFLEIIAKKFNPEILAHLEEELHEEVIEILGFKDSAKAISKLETDDAVYVVKDLDNEEREEILKSVSKEKREEINEALSYPENSVGRLMQQNFVAFKKECSVAQATYHLQNTKDLPDEFHYIVIVDDDYCPISEVMVSQILKNKKQILMSDIMDPKDFRSIPANMDQEEAAQIFTKYSMTYAPVVDEDGVLVGVIYSSDVVDIIQDEAEEDILLLGGVNDANLYSNSFETARSRAPWLLASLLTSAMAVTIIAIFSSAIEKIVALAVLMPIVASISGNSGTQALTVLVRAISTNEVSNIGAIKILIKEVLVSSFNGFLLALFAAIACFLWKNDLHLSAVFGVAILSTVIISGFFGSLIPLLLHKMKFDPAISSGVFLITITDAFSFLVFLGLASFLLS